MTGGIRALRARRRIAVPPVGKIAVAVAMALLLTSSGQVLAKPSSSNALSEAAPPLPAWSMNIFDRSVFRYQNPDQDGCVAAATIDMLNLVALQPGAELPPPGGGSLAETTFRWSVTLSWNTQKKILWFERKHMTTVKTDSGSDPHGWRNGLNYYGWGSLKAGMYKDAAFRTVDQAARAAIDSLARTGKPVGILAWSGGHAQFVTGYSVQGQDPRVGDNYTIVGVFLTDPLRRDALVNTFVSYWNWRTGPLAWRFTKDTQTDSPYVDPIDGKEGNLEWYGKWVIIEPTR